MDDLARNVMLGLLLTAVPGTLPVLAGWLLRKAVAGR